MRATRCVAELRPGRSITKVVSARAAQSPPAHPPHAATKPNIVRPVLRALPRRAGAATTYPEPTSASSSTSSSRENAAEALSALLSGGSGVLVASTAITSLHPLPTDATATATGEQTETLSSTRQRLERSLLPSSTPTRRASPSSTSPATPRRRLSSPARPTTKAGSSTPAPFHPTSRSSDERRRRQPGRPGERPRRSGDGLVMKLKQKRRPVEPTMGLGNLVANGEAGTRRGRQPTTSAVASFLQEISNTGLLTKEQEITYTVEAQELMRLEAVHAALVLREGRDVTLDEWALEAQLPPRTLKHRIHSGKAAKVLMVEHNVRLAVHVARRYANKGVPMGDLVQEGMSGLIRAIEKFDPALGFRFSTYAHYWVRQGITRAVSDQSRTIRLPVHVYDTLSKIRKARRELEHGCGDDGPSDGTVARYLGFTEAKVTAVLQSALPTVSLGESQFNPNPNHGGDQPSTRADAVEDLAAVAPEESCELGMLGHDMQRALSMLAPRERNILCMRYGLASADGGCMTLKDIGRAYGLTRERIRQILDRALRKLRHPQRTGRMLGDYVHLLHR